MFRSISRVARQRPGRLVRQPRETAPALINGLRQIDVTPVVQRMPETKKRRRRKSSGDSIDYLRRRIGLLSRRNGNDVRPTNQSMDLLNAISSPLLR